MPTLVLAEKNDQVATYAKSLGRTIEKRKGVTIVDSDLLQDECHIVAASGHLRELVEPKAYDSKYEHWNYEDLPISPGKFQFAWIRGRKGLFDTIKSEAAKCNQIIIATDPDQEGETIGYSILSQVPHGVEKITGRLWNSSLTVGGTQKAFRYLRDPKETKNLAVAGDTRAKADWLVGMNESRILGIKLNMMGYGNGWSAGRVQTPALALVVKNDDEITNFKPHTYWKISLVDPDHNIQFNNDEKYFDQTEASQLYGSLDKQATVQSIEHKRVNQVAPKLFNLSDVQGFASKNFGYSPDKTMEIYESLYLKQFLTYPRTEHNKITHYEFEIIRDHLEELQDLVDLHFDPVNKEPRKEFVDDKKVMEHVANVPTETLPDLNKLTEEQRNIYVAVARHSLLMFAPDFIYDKTVVTVKDQNLEFKTSGQVVIDPGFTALAKIEKKDTVLPSYQESQVIAVKPGLKKDVTKPPKRITEANMIKTFLPKYNLGTPATRASILKELISKRHYINKNRKGELLPTDRGRIVCEFFDGEVIANPDLTAQWETALKKIGKGQFPQDKFLKQIDQLCHLQTTKFKSKTPKISYQPTDKPIERNSTAFACPKCGKGQLEMIKGKKNGKDYMFFGCNNKDCHFSLPSIISGKTLDKSIIQDLLTKKSTDIITFKKQKKRGTYKARLIINEKWEVKLEFA